MNQPRSRGRELEKGHKNMGIISTCFKSPKPLYIWVQNKDIHTKIDKILIFDGAVESY